MRWGFLRADGAIGLELLPQAAPVERVGVGA